MWHTAGVIAGWDSWVWVEADASKDKDRGLYRDDLAKGAWIVN